MQDVLVLVSTSPLVLPIPITSYGIPFYTAGGMTILPSISPFVPVPVVFTIFDLSGITHTPQSFLEGCSNVLYAYLNGCDDLVKIDDWFMYNCCNLRGVTFRGSFTHLQFVGESFLQGCAALQYVDLSHCDELCVIGDGFCSGCISLVTCNLRGCQKLTAIGHDFLSGCRALNEVVFPPRSTPPLTITVGDGYAAGCPTRIRSMVDRYIDQI
eukprot:PhF_6_TR31116/c0_g1_i1/m.45540